MLLSLRFASKSKIILLGILAVVTLAFTQYLCDWNTITIGSGILQSTNYKSYSTVGQTAIGSLSSTNFYAYIGFWYPEISTGITEDMGSEIINIEPITTKLYRANPNPFNVQTTIRYSLAKKCKVSLLIHDITGRLITTLVNEEKEAGVYNINWNVKNTQPRQLAAGIYFYTLRTKDYNKTNKIILTD